MKTLVLGGAVSGRAAALLARRLDHAVMVYDRDASVAPRLREDRIPVTTGEWSRRLLDRIELVITSPGFPERADAIVEAQAAGIPVWSELEFAARHISAPLIAVTGTNGKTTVTELAADMLARSGRNTVAAGNIGTPLSDVADRPLDVVVVEASSFQLRFVDTFHPEIAVLLNIAPDHLDWHGSLDAYAAAKANIFRNQEADDVIVFDADDAGAVAAVAPAPSRHLPVSGRRRPPGGLGVGNGKLHLGEVVIPLDGVPVSDPAFLVDLIAAGAVALAAGTSPDRVEEAIRGFQPGAHRRTVVGEWDGVTWVNDSKATNPHAAVSSAGAYDSVILIAGGRNKGLDLDELATGPTVRHVVAIGEAAEELRRAAGPEAVTLAATIEEAVAIADQMARPGDTVLLAPGCASFDMFGSYAERGDKFARAVRQRKEHG